MQIPTSHMVSLKKVPQCKTIPSPSIPLSHPPSAVIYVVPSAVQQCAVCCGVNIAFASLTLSFIVHKLSHSHAYTPLSYFFSLRGFRTVAVAAQGFGGRRPLRELYDDRLVAAAAAAVAAFAAEGPALAGVALAGGRRERR